MPNQNKLDQPVVFERLANILDNLHEKIGQNLTIYQKDEQLFRDFSSPDGNTQGSLLTYSGDIIEKLIHTKINAPKMGFGTTRLVVWLNASVQVPHLAFEFGTTPNLFFYMDYLPRVDLWTDLNYLQHYYEAAGATHADLREQSDLSVFVSKSLYIRQLQSPAHICFTGSNSEETLELIQNMAHEMCDCWLSWVSQADAVPEAYQEQLAERDLHMRRMSAERDPGNAAVARIFGKDFTDKLVKALWQKEPVNPDAD